MSASPVSRTWLLAAGVALLVTSVGALAARAFITVGTGDVTGVYYHAGGGLCALVNAGRTDHQIRCTVASSEGSVANIDALRRGERALGFAQADLAQQAYSGSGAFENAGPFDGLRTVLSLHPETVTVIAAPGSEIGSVQDLRGKRVNVGPAGSGQRASMQSLMNALGWTDNDFEAATGLPASEQVGALCGGDIDAAVLIAGHPNSSVKRALGCGATLVPVSGPAINRLVRGAPYYSTTVIPGGLYPDVSQDVPTYGVTALLLSSTNTARETVFEVTKSVVEQVGEFRGWHRALGDLEPAGMAAGTGAIDAPVHPGARMYFEDNDLL